MNKIQQSNQRFEGSRRLPSLHSLRAFEATARCGSVTLAAEELSVTHSAISHQVKALEACLGVALMRRRGRNVVLTAEGEAYYPELQAAFDRIAQATLRVGRASTRATLAVNVSSSFAVRWLIPRLGAFCAANPQVDVRLSTTEKMLEFNPRMFDISIRSLNEAELSALRKRRDWRGVEAQPFLEESNFPVCSPALLRDKPLAQPAELRRHTLLHSRSCERAWQEWLAVAGTKVKPQASLTFDNLHFALQAAARGLGVALGSLPLVQEELANGTLVAPFPGIESEFEKYYAIYPAEQTVAPAVSDFCRWLMGSASASAAPMTAGTSRPRPPRRKDSAVRSRVLSEHPAHGGGL